jgi:hypothetical protein
MNQSCSLEKLHRENMSHLIQSSRWYGWKTTPMYWMVPFNEMWKTYCRYSTKAICIYTIHIVYPKIDIYIYRSIYLSIYLHYMIICIWIVLYIYIYIPNASRWFLVQSTSSHASTGSKGRSLDLATSTISEELSWWRCKKIREKKITSKITFFEWSPTWNSIVSYLLTYHLEVCIYIYVCVALWHISSDILSDILSRIHFDILSGIYSYTLSGIYSDILFAFCLASILTFYLASFQAFIRAFFLASIPTFSLTVFLAFYLASILTFCLAFYLTFSLALNFQLHMYICSKSK